MRLTTFLLPTLYFENFQTHKGQKNDTMNECPYILHLDSSIVICAVSLSINTHFYALKHLKVS